jgi:hypothetical protein
MNNDKNLEKSFSLNLTMNLNKSITNKTDKYWLDQLRFELLNKKELNISCWFGFCKIFYRKKAY